MNVRKLLTSHGLCMLLLLGMAATCAWAEAWQPARNDQPPPAVRGVPEASADLTKYLEPLRRHAVRLQWAKEGIEDLPDRSTHKTSAGAERWAAQVREAGQRAADECSAFRSTLHDFLHAETRRGLPEEMRLIEENIELVGDTVAAYREHVDLDYRLPKPLLQVLKQEAEDYARRLARQRIAEVLESQGVAEVLTSRGWEEARRKAEERVQAKLMQRMDALTERAFRLGFHDEASLRKAVRQRARGEVEKQVVQMVARFTGNSLVIEVLGEVIVSWIDDELLPRLKEAFRGKRGLVQRVQVSIGTMESAEFRLNQLPPGAKLSDVEAALRQAGGTINASRYLVGDLKKQGRYALLLELGGALDHLETLMQRTRDRFLLGKKKDLEELEDDEQVLVELCRLLGRMAMAVKVPAVDEPKEVGKPATEEKRVLSDAQCEALRQGYFKQCHEMREGFAKRNCEPPPGKKGPGYSGCAIDPRGCLGAVVNDALDCQGNNRRIGCGKALLGDYLNCLKSCNERLVQRKLNIFSIGPCGQDCNNTASQAMAACKGGAAVPPKASPAADPGSAAQPPSSQEQTPALEHPQALPAYPSPAATASFHDEFDAPLLDSRWRIVSPNPASSVRLTGTGSLRITAVARGGGSDLAPGPNNNAPRVLQPVSGNWTLETRVDFAPSSPFQGAGVLVCFDPKPESANCWRVIERQFWGRGQIINFSGAQKDFAGTTTYLRLRKQGSTYTAWYSGDGRAWIEAGTRKEQRAPTHAGVMTSRQAHDRNLKLDSVATFDYIHITPE